ncbi:hypothetical protein [Algoriphagus chordae]|uniref:Uncharacterized protein n=1 Tax=Algoriphagus chordae TaxID=237019 RepID=A0A2W7QS03_9BACT|nr:hypothetical protein [Algoriphagus chordae]PZX51378.1 hypothetical protein LV85_02322 [Algoriphagus chordae]
MNTVLRIYLVLIFAGSALNAGSENESINSGFPLEASNFATNPSYPQHLIGIADCMNAAIRLENSSTKKLANHSTEEAAFVERSK